MMQGWFGGTTTTPAAAALETIVAASRRLFFFVPSYSALVVSLLAFVVAMAIAMSFLRYKISRGWIDLRTALSTPPHNDTDPPPPPTTTKKGKAVIITGGSAGLGYHVALDLATRRHDYGITTILLGCRDVVKGQDAADRITASQATTTPGLPCQVVCLPLDLSSLASVVKFADAVQIACGNDTNIHALVLNAGVWVPMDKKWKTMDGYEIHFGVNHLGHQLLVQRLLPHLQQQQQNGGSSRIVWVTSSLLKHGRINMDDPDEFVHRGRTAAPATAASVPSGKNDGTTHAKAPPSFCPTGYCDSKLMNALACRHLAATTTSGVVTTYAVCPGFCRTELGRYAPFVWWKKWLLAPIFWIVQRPAHIGAHGILYCVLQDSQQMVNGGLYRDGRVLWEDNGGTAYVDRYVHDTTAQRLLDLCASLLKEYLPETK